MINFGKNIIHFSEDTLEFSCKFIKSSHVELVGEGVLHYDTKTAMRVTKFGSSFNNYPFAASRIMKTHCTD